MAKESQKPATSMKRCITVHTLYFEKASPFWVSYNLLLIFCIESEPFVVSAAAQRPNKKGNYKCCKCNYNARAYINGLKEHFLISHDVDVGGLIREETNDFSTFEGWDHRGWEITSAHQSALTISEFADSMDIDAGFVAHSQLTSLCTDVDEQYRANDEATGSGDLLDMDNADEPMTVDAQTSSIPSITVTAAGPHDGNPDLLGEKTTDFPPPGDISRNTASQSSQDSRCDPPIAVEPLHLSTENLLPFDSTGDEAMINVHDTSVVPDGCPFNISRLGDNGTKVLVCTLCQSAVNPAAIKDHFGEKKHKEKHTKWAALSKQAQEWFGGLEQDGTFARNAESVPIQTAGICWPPVEGLPIRPDGYQCCVCVKCCTSETASCDCSSALGKRETRKRISIQQVFQKFIAVDPDLSDASPVAQLYIKLGYPSKLNALSSSARPIHSLETPPWVRETGWLDTLGPFLENGPTPLLRLISPPFHDKDSLLASPLRRIIELYMGMVREFAAGNHHIVFKTRQCLQAVPTYVPFFIKYLKLILLHYTVAKRIPQLGMFSKRHLCRAMLCRFTS